MTVTVTNPRATSVDAAPGSTIGPCVSLATGTLSPDLRVNYAYGMVLGLDEFLQEQLHNLSKDYLHERAMHGYGTVSGLAVSTAPVPGAADFRISVTQGIAIDQWGREIVLRCDQCVQLGAWLAAEENSKPGIIGQHLGPSGEVTVYVVASYAECLDRLVPLPGQPCSSSDQVTVASRIRDAWDLELRWAPPPMPRWDTDRRLARLLDGVTIVSGLIPADSDEHAITEAVLALAAFADDGPSDLAPELGPSGTGWRLPAQTAAASLDRIFTAWVTKVRPVLHPDLVEPEASSDAAILLSTITFVPASPFKASAAAITACDQPDDDGRPYLLHTQLIQELHWLADVVGGAPPTEDQTLATLAPKLDANELTVDAWFHPLKPVRLPPTLDGFDEDRVALSYTTSAVSPDAQGFSSRWTLTIPATDGGAATGAGQIGVVFPAANVLVGDAATTLAQVEHKGTTFLNTDDKTGDVTAYGIVPPPVLPPKQTYPVEFLTVTDTNINEEEAVLELWFHPSPHDIKNIANVAKPVMKLYDDTTGNPLKFQLNPTTWSPNAWTITVKQPAPGKQIPLYIRYQFPTKEFELTVGNAAIPLEEWIRKEQLVYEGYEAVGPPEIIAFSRTAPMVVP